MLKNKILNGELLTSEEVESIAYGEFDVVEEELLDKNRWFTSVSIVIVIDGRYFGIYWEHGATEMQGNTFEEQVAKELKRIEVTKYEYVPL